MDYKYSKSIYKANKCKRIKSTRKVSNRIRCQGSVSVCVSYLYLGMLSE